ncbi:hypothetical protein T06_1609 [Trichinella sp. T6]|nr:hypothetical protein T06_1609 [Trichinella sp. T6]
MPGWQFNVGWSVIETDNRIISLCIYVIVVVFCGKGEKNSNDETQPPMPIALQYPDLKCSPTSVSELLVVVFL